MDNQESSPVTALDDAIASAQEALKSFEQHQDAERLRYERGVAKLIATADELRAVNPKAKKLPLQPGERTGYNISIRLLDDAARECSPAERGAVLEFQSLLKKMFGSTAQ